MKIKKLLGNIVSAVMAFGILTTSVSYAETSEPKTYTVYDDEGNEYVVSENEVLGVLYDKYGNVKEETLVSPQQDFVSGSKTTLAPGDYFITYQYTVLNSFHAGFFFNYYQEDPATTPGGSLNISLQDCDSIGGVRRTVKSQTFSTTFKYDPVLDKEALGGGYSRVVYIDRVTSSRPYYNARFENVGTKTITVCWCVGRDG